ncbi:MAG: hypothetical protein V4555_19520 [Acidobacteriota bacterium]
MTVANDAAPACTRQGAHAGDPSAAGAVMRKMLHLTKKTLSTASDLVRAARSFDRLDSTTVRLLSLGVLALGLAASASGQIAAPGTAPVSTQTAAGLNAYTGPKYDNRYEVYGGLSYMNGQAGQDLQAKYNMGGGEAMFTYWLGHGPVGRLGLTADYRLEAGTTPTQPNPGNNQAVHLNRVLVMQHIFAGGVTYRGFKNRYFAIDYHALGGETYGIFDHATKNYPGGSPVAACAAQQTVGQTGSLGLYCNHAAAWGAAGGSIDFNESQRVAVRLSPDMIFEHFGTETREYFSISMGILYRFGKR